MGRPVIGLVPVQRKVVPSTLRQATAAWRSCSRTFLPNAVTHGDRARATRVSGSGFDGILELAVSNGGEPIPDAAREHLFLPFYRDKLKPHQQGLGLGLYIASQIAQAHGGRIDLVSDTTETRFTFRMPVD